MEIVEIPDNHSCILYRDFLSIEDNRTIYQHAIANSGHATGSRIFGGQKGGVNNEHYRKSKVLMNEETANVRKLLMNQLRPMVPDLLVRLDLPQFARYNYEVQLTAHNDGDFYKPHIDTGPGQATRLMTFVYYFHSEPKPYTGGQLLFLRNQPKPLIIEPENNSIVFFDSSLLHAVHPVSCPDKKFEHSRFTMNGWVHKKVEVTGEQPAKEQLS